MFYRISSLLMLALLVANAAFAAPAQKQFSDWQVTCNNQNFCSTRNTGLHQGLVMTITRSAGARTDASLRIDLGNMESADVKVPPVAPRLRLDGVPLVIQPNEWKISPHHLMTNNPAAINGLQGAIMNGDKITLADGVGIISLSGLKAALLFIDSQQKRIGSETAWIKKGDGPPLSVPPAPPLKEVAAATTASTPLSHDELNDLLDYGTWRMNNSQCSLDPQRREVRVFPLTDDKALMLTSCEAGAYNVVYLAWVISRQKPFVARVIHLRLPFVPDGGSAELELMNVGWDEHGKELTTLAKGRGPGDCGVATRWRFDGQRFRLVRYAEEPACDGWHKAAGWPTLWVTK
ncbi:DUF1176 domain-containing protein [Enterobacter sp. Cy-643]|uniref:DUF1176 domain-containing protein n=1 Tax=Enterobacter sp. Cy-643 TaxID=2608346 RepID=UPI0014241435|nr:DUF1176 domain-containing protein [Enterobacter sp. Cy-643]NIF30773.1 DUF1176 domain-containing protein [Enterobacter sp. Cy-643]